MAVRDDIKTRVMQCLNELYPDTNALSDVMTFDMDNFMDEAGKRVALMSPLNALGGGNESVATPTANADGSGKVTLPANFLRLILFQMQGWLRPVVGNEVITEESPRYALQFNPLTRGGIAKPIVAITNGGTTLEYYSLPTTVASHSVKLFRYFSYSTITDNFPTKLHEPTAWLTAALIFDVMENANSEMARNRCAELIQLL